jgi:hypothetical protein
MYNIAPHPTKKALGGVHSKEVKVRLQKRLEAGWIRYHNISNQEPFDYTFMTFHEFKGLDLKYTCFNNLLLI